MSNYNSTLQSNNTDLQAILNTINELPSAGGSDPVLQDKTVTPTTSSQTIKADSGYDGLDTVTVNAMPTATQATPSITINASGLITATATQTAGYVAAGSKSTTKQLAFQPAKTITPSTASQIAVSSGYYTGGAVTVKGDSNLVAGNIKSGVSIFGVNGTYVGSGGTGDTSMEDGLVTKTLTSYTNDRVTTIGGYAFYCCSKLTTASFPKATTIGSSAFAYCSSLTTISFPKATTIGSSAFAYCSKLTTASFPLVTTIGSSAFAYCFSLTTISFPKATTIDNYAFYYCSKLTTASFPLVTTISNYAFAYCSSITTISFPKATTISNYAFYHCTKLTTASFPLVTTIGNYALYQCSSLTTISFPKATTIGGGAFYDCYKLTTASFPLVTTISRSAFAYCSSLTTISFPLVTTISNSAFAYCCNLKSLYLTGSSVCKLSNSNAFSSTPIGGYSTSARTYGSIYVPASLLTSYKNATNWTYFSSRFVGI